MKKRILVAVLVVLLALPMVAYVDDARAFDLSGILGGLFSKNQDTVTIPREEYEQLQKYKQLEEIYQYIQEYYYVEPDTDKMLEMATRGLLYGLEDPYSFYYSPQEWSDLWADDEGEYAGIGVQMLGNADDLSVTITRVFKDTPAEAAGVRKGDVFYMVEDIEVTAYTMQNAVNIMRGRTGESVHISVRRDGEILEFDIERAIIKMNRLEYAMLDDNVGYICLYEFAGDCAEAFEKALTALEEQGATALVVDLRDNPGGWVDDGVAIADLFLDKELIVYEQDRAGNQDKLYATEGRDDIPLVLLVNENSASTSEILSGALKDYGRAKIVGTTTFGKGIIQYVIALETSDEDAEAGFQFTVAQYFTPLGNPVHEIGIAPDIEVAMPEELSGVYFALGEMADPQLKAAWEAASAMND